MRFFNTIITVVLTASLFQNSVSAGQGGSPGEQLSSASKEFVGALKQLGDTLDRQPAKVEPSKWKTIKQGATEIKQKVGRLRQTIEAAQNTGEELGIANGRLQSRLDALVGEYSRLADEAGAQAEHLSEPMASTVKREKLMWSTWAKIAASFKDHYSQTLERFQQQAEDLKVVDPILTRLAKGADQTIELASVGERLDQQVSTLATLADELNGILAAFGSLADQTRSAIAMKDPSGSLATAGLASADQEQYRNWTDNQGRPLRARIVSAQGNLVKLQAQETGRVYDFPVDKLSKADQAEVRRVEILRSVACAASY